MTAVQSIPVAPLGRAYSEGRLSIDEVAKLVGMPVGDAVARLEELGISRPLGAIRLSEIERQQRIRQIAEDRTRRSGQPEKRSDLVRREVVATQRIEDVDARPWLTLEPAE